MNDRQTFWVLVLVAAIFAFAGWWVGRQSYDREPWTLNSGITLEFNQTRWTCDLVGYRNGELELTACTVIETKE